MKYVLNTRIIKAVAAKPLSATAVRPNTVTIMLLIAHQQLHTGRKFATTEKRSVMTEKTYGMKRKKYARTGKNLSTIESTNLADPVLADAIEYLICPL
jgi:hypothetical protein